MSLLVAVPVAGMTIFGVVARTADDGGSFAREHPDGTDLVVTRPIGDYLDLDAYLPAGASVSEMMTVWAGVESTSRIVPNVQFWDDGNFEAGSVLSTDEGREPQGVADQDDGIWLTSTLADDLGVGVGDALTLLHPEGEWTVAGIGSTRRGFDDRLIVMPDLPVDQFRDGLVHRATLIDLPDDVSPGEVDAIGWAIRSALDAGSEGIAGGWALWNEGDPATDTELAWGWVAGTVALGATGIIIAAAFATSARRQLVTIGLLSANGASERLARRTLSLQGAWTGAAGSVVGLVLGTVVLIAGRSRIERARGHVLAPYEFGVGYLLLIAVTGIVASTIAALVPARTASRVPVMAALAGRRPLGVVPPRLVPRGLGLSALGALLLVMASLSNDGGALPTIGAVVGGVLVLAGMCCCSPLAVEWMSRGSGPLGGSWRLAGRSLGRTRTRSAAVVTAVAVIVAMTTAGAAVAATANDDDGARTLPVDAVALIPNREYPDPFAGEIDLEPLADFPVDASRVATIETIVASSSFHPRRVATWDPAPFAASRDGHWEGGFAFVELTVADEATMDLYELSAAERDSLDAVGLLALSPDYLLAGVTGNVLRIPTDRGEVTLDLGYRTHVVDAMRGDDNEFDGVFGVDAFMITEAAAEDAGLGIVTRGGFFRSESPLTRSQRDALEEAIYGPATNDIAQYYRDVPLAPEASQWSVVFHWPDGGPSGEAMQAVLVGIAFVLTLLVVAIGLALAAAEGADERDVLVAVGGRPGTMRSLAGAKAAMLTLTAVVLAVPFGLLPTFAVMRASDGRFQIPWLAIGALVVAVPVLAGAATCLVSAVAQRARPVRFSNLAFD